MHKVKLVFQFTGIKRYLIYPVEGGKIAFIFPFYTVSKQCVIYFKRVTAWGTRFTFFLPTIYPLFLKVYEYMGTYICIYFQTPLLLNTLYLNADIPADKFI